MNRTARTAVILTAVASLLGVGAAPALAAPQANCQTVTGGPVALPQYFCNAVKTGSVKAGPADRAAKAAFQCLAEAMIGRGADQLYRAYKLAKSAEKADDAGDMISAGDIAGSLFCGQTVYNAYHGK